MKQVLTLLSAVALIAVFWYILYAVADALLYYK